MALLCIVREQHLLFLLIAQLLTSLFFIYKSKNYLSYISEILLIVGSLWYHQILAWDTQIAILYLAEYILLKVLLLIIVWLAKRFAFWVLVVISHKKGFLKKLFISNKWFARMQSRIWHKVNYGFKIKKGIPSMVNKTHKATGVRFDEDGFPKFKVIAKVKLKRKYWKKDREVHFYHASRMLYERAQKNTIFRRKFTKKEISEFKNGSVPSKYTWHHHQDRGVLQLVETKIHSNAKHVGGFSIWGKGN